MHPKVMLFEQATSALDPELTGEALRIMEGLAKGGMTMMPVTHEMGFARKVAHIAVFMHNGKVWESGPSGQIFASPQTAELRRLLASGLK